MITSTTNAVIRQTATGSWLESLGKMKPSVPMQQFLNTESIDTISVDAGFFGAVPFPTQFLGSRQHKAIKAYTQTITPKKWELTVDWDVPTYEDDQTKTAAQTAAKMASRCQEFYVKRWTQVMEAGTGTTIGTGYDGVALYSGSHPESGTNQDNTHTSAAATNTQPTVAELESAVDAAMQLALAYTDDQAVPVGGNITDWAFCMPPAYTVVAAKAFGSNSSVGGQAVLTADSTGGTGVFRGLEYFVNPYLVTNTDRFYGLRKGSSGGPAPFVLVQRVPWRFEVKDASNSDASFDGDIITFGAYGRFEVGYGDWRASFVHVFS